MCASTYEITRFFKCFEWLFIFWEFWMLMSLINTRLFFNKAIGFINWLIRIHGFDGGIIVTERALRRFQRDLWILLVLNLIIIILIRFI
jgi:hypothetical protein